MALSSSNLMGWLNGQTNGSLVVMALASVGMLTLLKYPISLIRVLLSFTPLSKPFRISLRSLAQNKNSNEGPPAWAIITGPTGGIGKEFALQLFRSGFSVLLVGRNQNKLDDLAKEISGSGSSRGLVKTHAIDLGNASESDWEKFGLKLKDVSEEAPISIVINNAGVSHSGPVPFESTPLSELASIPAVNVVAVLRLTHLALPHMLKNRRGLVLNVGSFSALVPSPLLATYSGSKAFLYTWSQALGAELESKGIDVRLLNTFFVATEMAKIRRSSFMIPSPKTFVRSVLNNLGLSGGAIGKRYISTTYLAHALSQWAVDRFFSESFWLNYNLNLQRSTMKRVEAKRLRELKKLEDESSKRS